MKCKVEGCEKEVVYKQQNVCQMHYFRMMRTGSYDKKKKKYRLQNPAGYQKLFEPEHILSNKDGYVYEHRFVYFNEISNKVEKCKLCGDKITWGDCHIDHIDDDVSNNNKDNLRALCRPCNTFRGYTEESTGTLVEYNGKRLTVAAWARQKGVQVSGNTIKLRLEKGMSPKDAIYGKRKTHHNTKTKVLIMKFDRMRNIV